jgi:DNA-binding transcriptional LysR family regulator
MIDECFRTAGISYRCMMEIATSEALKKAVVEGLGCSIVSLCSIEMEKAVGALAHIRIAGAPIKREFRAIIHKEKRLSGAVRLFLEVLNVKISSSAGESRTPADRA